MKKAIPSLYFTNLISARPLMGPAGAGSLAQVINAAIANKARFQQMREFFGDFLGRDFGSGSLDFASVSHRANFDPGTLLPQSKYSLRGVYIL